MVRCISRCVAYKKWKAVGSWKRLNSWNCGGIGKELMSEYMVKGLYKAISTLSITYKQWPSCGSFSAAKLEHGRQSHNISAHLKKN